MRKFRVLSLVFVLALLAGCGSKTEPSKTNPGDPSKMMKMSGPPAGMPTGKQ